MRSNCHLQSNAVWFSARKFKCWFWTIAMRIHGSSSKKSGQRTKNHRVGTTVSCRASRGYTTVFNVARTDATPPLHRQSSYHLDTYLSRHRCRTSLQKVRLYSLSISNQILIKKQMNTLLYPFVSNTFHECIHALTNPMMIPTIQGNV